MIHIEKLGTSTGICLEMQNAPLLILIAEKGFIMCGYLNIEIAEQMNDCACVVRGVRTFEDVMNAEIAAATTKAKELGIVKGMSGRDALRLME